MSLARADCVHMPLSELQEILRDDPELWAVHCPICRVVAFAHHGDYICIVCRDEGGRSQESTLLLAVEDPEDPNSGLPLDLR